eukprot:538593-Hanusia_phi.AAC.3
MSNTHSLLQSAANYGNAAFCFSSSIDAAVTVVACYSPESPPALCVTTSKVLVVLSVVVLSDRLLQDRILINCPEGTQVKEDDQREGMASEVIGIATDDREQVEAD